MLLAYRTDKQLKIKFLYFTPNFLNLAPSTSVQEFGCGISCIILVVCRYHGRQADYSTGLLHSSVTNRFFFCLCFKAIAITLALNDTTEITIIQPDPTYTINRPAETSFIEKESLCFSHGGSRFFDSEVSICQWW